MQVCTKKRERFYTGGHWIISSHGRILILVGRSENSKYAFSINRWVGKSRQSGVRPCLSKSMKKITLMHWVRSIIRIVPCWRPSLHRQSNRSPATLKSFLILFPILFCYCGGSLGGHSLKKEQHFTFWKNSLVCLQSNPQLSFLIG